jgi:hypothetical protein
VIVVTLKGQTSGNSVPRYCGERHVRAEHARLSTTLQPDLQNWFRLFGWFLALEQKFPDE